MHRDEEVRAFLADSRDTKIKRSEAIELGNDDVLIGDCENPIVRGGTTWCL
jgi:hypothetical protein